MSYIGRGIDSIDNISTLDNLSFNGSDATFNLTQNSVAFVPVSADALQIQIDGVIQANNFTISGSTVTFDFTPNSGSVCNSIKHFGVGLLTTVSDGAVTNVKLGADSVNGSKIADNSIDSEHYVDGSIDLAHLSSDSVNESKLQVSNSPTNGYFLSAQSGNTGGLTWAEASGGLTLLSTVNVTSTVNSISMNSVFTTEYDNYFFVFNDVTGGIDNQPIYLRFKDTSDGALTASVYDYVNWGSNTSGSTVADYSANTSAIVLANNVQIGSGNVTEAKAYFFGTIYVPRDNSSPRGSVSATVMNWQSAYSRGSMLYTNQSSAVFDNTTAVGGIQVYGGGGGGPTYLDNGSFKMYGIKGT